MKGLAHIGLVLGILGASCAQEVSTEEPLEPFFDPDGQALADISSQCVFAGTTATLTLNADDTAYISGKPATKAWYVNGVPCGSSTLSNTKKLVIVGSPYGGETVYVDFIDGLYFMGTTTAPGMTVDLDMGTDSLRYRLTAGNDTMTLGELAATIGTDSNVDVTYSGADDIRVVGGAGNDTLTATGSAATGDPFTTTAIFYGGDGADFLRGGAWLDTLYGDDGADTLSAGTEALPDAQSDTLVGGNGADTADYSGRTSSVTVSLDGVANDTDGDNVAADIETILGGTGNDTLTGTSNADTIKGGAGRDYITGSGGADVLYGDDGADTFVEESASNGGDTFHGGAGIDAVWYDSRTNAVSISNDGTANDGETGELDNVLTDVEGMSGGSGNDTIVGGAGGDTLKGNAGNDSITGGAGADWLQGGTGTDSLIGGSGDDVFDEGISSNGGDVLVGGAGYDLVSYAGRDNAVNVSLDDVANDGEASETDNVGSFESIVGGLGADTLTGGAASERIEGGLGNDTISGGGGDDMLVGNEGTDVISGGSGDADICIDPQVEISSGCELPAYGTSTSGPSPYCSGNGLTNVPYAYGTGSASDPFYVCTATQLNRIGQLGPYGGVYRIGADISLAGVTWNFIGNASNNKFTGSVDGRYHTISDFSISTPGTASGLFGFTLSATIKNLTINLGGNLDAGTNGTRAGVLIGSMNGGSVTNVTVGGSGTVKGESYIGGAIGTCGNGGTITNLNVSVNVTSNPTWAYVGGAIGDSACAVSRTVATGTVDCTANGGTGCGGLIGNVSGSTVTTSYSTANVLATTSTTGLFMNQGWVGGFIGYCSGTTITDSYAAGNVTVTSMNATGGFIGKTHASCTVTRTYARGVVSGAGTIGGFTGVSAGTITASFWDTTTSGQGSSASGTAATTAEMTLTDGNMNSLIDIFDTASWSSVTWDLTPGAYPTLR